MATPKTIGASHATAIGAPATASDPLIVETIRLRTLAASGLLPPVPGDSATSDVAWGDPEIGTYHSFGGRLIADFGPEATKRYF